MRWDRLFEDLEDQLASEWEAERAALESEAERLRLSKTTLRERLGPLIGGDAVTVEVGDGSPQRGIICAVGSDFAALRPDRAATGDGLRVRARDGLIIVPLAAVVWFGVAHADLLRTARAGAAVHIDAPGVAPASPSRLSDRMTLGFVLRDCARKRRALRAGLHSGDILTGTIDRVGADHLDLALHDVDMPRRAESVRGHRMLPLASLAWVRLEGIADHDLP